MRTAQSWPLPIFGVGTVNNIRFGPFPSGAFVSYALIIADSQSPPTKIALEVAFGDLNSSQVAFQVLPGLQVGVQAQWYTQIPIQVRMSETGCSYLWLKFTTTSGGIGAGAMACWLAVHDPANPLSKHPSGFDPPPGVKYGDGLEPKKGPQYAHDLHGGGIKDWNEIAGGGSGKKKGGLQTHDLHGGDDDFDSGFHPFLPFGG